MPGTMFFCYLDHHKKWSNNEKVANLDKLKSTVGIRKPEIQTLETSENGLFVVLYSDRIITILGSHHLPHLNRDLNSLLFRSPFK